MATYHVAKTGLDTNDGSSGSPWLTVRKASRTVVKGDTVIIHADGGVSTEYVETAGPSIDWSTDITGGFGSSFDAAEKITFQAASGDEGLVVLKRDTAGGTLVIDLRATSATAATRFVEFYNLIFDGYKNSASAPTYTPVYINPSARADNTVHDIRFYGCEIRNSGNGSNLFVEGSGTNILGVPYNIWFKKDPTTGRRGKIYSAGTPPSTTNHGVYFQGKDGIIEDTDVYANNGLGIQIHKDSALSGQLDNVTINRVRSYDNVQTGIYYGGGGANGGANGKIWNCIAHDNATHGIRFDNGTTNGQIYNCTSVRNTSANFTLGAEAVKPTGVLITNCVARKLGVTTTNFSESTSGFTITTCININATDTDATDPLFTDPANDDFTLQSGSPCKNAGTDLSASFTTDFLGNTRPSGSAFDIGAYEFIEALIRLAYRLS